MFSETGMTPMLSWDLIRVFLALYRAQSYEGAAQILGVDVSTTRRKLLALEAEVGSPLLIRRDGQFVLTRGYEELLLAAQQMETASTLFSEHSNAARHAGTIRISTLDIFADLLVPEILRFSQANREILLEVTTEPGFVDLERDGVDIAIRLARPTRGLNGLRRLANVEFGLYGSRSYLAGSAGRAEGDHDLLALCAHFVSDDHQFELADEQWNKERLGNVLARADSYPMLLRLCASSMGLALLPNYLARRDPELVAFRPESVRLSVGLWIVIRRDVARMPKIRRCIHFIDQAFAALGPLLSDGALAAVCG